MDGQVSLLTMMHVCPSCSSELVQPVQWWEEVGGRRWQVLLRCPECDWCDRASYPQSEVDRYDEELERGAYDLMQGLKMLTRANMEEEAERFSEALAVGAVLPEDF